MRRILWEELYGSACKSQIIIMEIEKLFRLNLRIIAIVFLAVSLLHVIWNWFFPTYMELRGLTEIQLNAIYLLNSSVGLWFFICSILLFGASNTMSITFPQLRALTALIIILLTSRLLLEFIFPLQIPFLFMTTPTLFLKAFLSFFIIILAIPEIKFQLWRKHH